MHEPSYWDSARPVETPADDAAQHQQFYLTARPPLPLAAYSGDSKYSSMSSQTLQRLMRNKTPAQVGLETS